MQYCYHHVPSLCLSYSNSFYSTLSCSYRIQRFTYVPCLQPLVFLLSTNEHKGAHGMKTYRHSHWLTSCCWGEISSVSLAAPTFPAPIQSSVRSSHLRDRCSAIPLWHTLYFLKMCQWKIQTRLLFLSLSKKNNPQRRMCTPSILIHWTLRT